MAWLKLTRKALYLMQDNSSSYLEKIDLQPHNLAKEEFKLAVPLQWFQNADAPGRMAIVIDASQAEPTLIQTVPTPAALKRVVTAKAWGASPAKQASPLTTPQYIVIHHTAHKDNPNPPNDDSKGTLEGAERLAKTIQNTHLSLGWVDSGHNFLNSTGGFVLEGRQGSLEAIIKGRCLQSAHAAQDPGKLAGGNASPGIENEGNFMTFQMGQKQWDSLVSLCAAICQTCKLKPEDIRGHRDFSSTACPGDWLYNQLPRLRQEVRNKLANG